MSNIDPSTVSSFGDEWSRFDQTAVSAAEAREAFEEYFAVFPWLDLPPMAEGFDMGGLRKWPMGALGGSASGASAFNRSIGRD
jgi:hypothetical protein